MATAETQGKAAYRKEATGGIDNAITFRTAAASKKAADGLPASPPPPDHDYQAFVYEGEDFSRLGV